MVIVPFRSSATLHYPPVVTCCLIAVTFIASVMVLMRGGIDSVGMHFTVINPLHWLTSFFVHLTVWHLLVNLVFIWVFGHILEGRFGPWLFLFCYLFIGIVQAISIQLLFVWMDFQGARVDGVAVGASAVVYGLMALALIFAFDQEMEMFVFLFFTFTTFEVNLGVLCILYFFLDFFLVLFTADLTAFFHLTGAVIGLVLGVYLTMRELVPEDGSNLIELSFGIKYGRRKAETKAKSEDEEQAEKWAQDEAEWSEALPNLVRLADAGHFEEVQRRMAKLLSSNQVAAWDSDILRKIIQGYLKAADWTAANKALQLYERLFPDEITTSLTVSWAHVHLEMALPRKALKTLQRMQGLAIRAEQKQVIVKLAERAKSMIKAGVLEPGDSRTAD